MPTVAIKLVCFDLGGVLVQICSHWLEACTIVGVEPPASMAVEAMTKPLWHVSKQHELGEIDDAAFDHQVAALTGLSPTDVANVAEAWLKGPYDGVDGLLDELDAAGLDTACLTNTNARHWRIMLGRTPGQAVPSLRRIRHRLASHLIGAAKPQAAAFEHVEDAAGVAPQSILFFDDAPDNCCGARARGWTARQIDPAGDPVAQIRDQLRCCGVLR